MAATTQPVTPPADDVVARGEQIDENGIRQQMETGNTSKLLMIN